MTNQNEMADQNEIQIFGLEEPGEDERGSWFKKSSELKVGRGEVNADELKLRLERFLTGMQDVVDSIPEFLGSFRLDSVTIAAEVSAKGSVSLLGTGGEIGGKGGITFNLKRNGPSR
jgi:hypothetical protein